MKEAMKSIDHTGSYIFSDGQLGQITMFRFDHPEDFASKLHARFIRQEVPYPALTKFALNESPFTNPIQMLKLLNEKGQIEVKRFNPASRGFSADHVSTVKFLDVPPRSPAPKKPNQKGFWDG
jgi:hypothetical protein